ncbi:helix-turn-helix domain-containing protein [Providencia stuartii]|uniref:helix-turn-helix domain-containing protein n=1 Tax=Providencia stuartii TaxID=588 RepID=UPI0024AA9263|nr:helix-turn-helix transcriptional regulator [Providencia stuartii]MCX3071369.1 helix-turn-helix transcriptional regulator [Providencia stuartii]
MLINERTPNSRIYIGNKLKELRKKNGLTEKELGTYLGISQQQVSRYERGINCVNVDLLAKLSELFQVPVKIFIPSDNVILK